MLNILCFGDSITHGEKDLDQGGWVERLKIDYFKQFSDCKKQEIKIYNLGIGGETTDGLVKRFEVEYNARVIKGQDSIVIFSYGINDIVIHKQKNTVPEKYFVHNLVECIETAKNDNAKIILFSLLPISVLIDGKTNQHRKLRFNQDIELYNQILERLSKELKCQYLDSYQSFIDAGKERLLSSDGVHPNAKGHQLLYELIKNKLGELNFNFSSAK